MLGQERERGRNENMGWESKETGPKRGKKK